MNQADIRRRQRDLIRASYDNDTRIRCIRHQLEAAYQAGDDLMAYWKVASPELTAYLDGIARAYR